MKLKDKKVVYLCVLDTEDLGQSQDTHFILNSEQLVSEETGLSSTH